MRTIPFSPPDISQGEIDEVVDTLKSGWITTGPKTKEFERQIASYCQTKRAVCLNSQTACQEMTLRLLGIKEGDEVIIPAYTYTATASVVCHVGATPVVVDVDERNFLIDYEAVKKAITEKTKAIIPVDLAGIPCDYDLLKKIVLEYKSLFKPNNDIQRAIGRIMILSDTAHSFGMTYQNKRSGSLADFSSFSFHAVKNLTTAEGGAVTWNEIEGIDSEWIYRNYMLLSLHGQSKDALEKTKLSSWEYDIIEPYYKCNMTDIMASIGLAQLRRYDSLLERRKEIINLYNEGLKDLPIALPCHYTKEYSSSGHLYLIRLLGFNFEKRNRFIIEMAKRGIATNVHYKPLPLLSAYKKRGFNIDDYPIAKSIFENEVTLPLHTKLTNEDVFYIISSVRELLVK